jgi:predicted site-specific integrase-resolvase
MKAKTQERMIGLAESAQRLRVPYQDAHRLLLTGAIRGQKRGGRWYVLAEDVDQLAERRLRDQALHA